MISSDVRVSNFLNQTIEGPESTVYTRRTTPSNRCRQVYICTYITHCTSTQSTDLASHACTTGNDGWINGSHIGEVICIHSDVSCMFLCKCVYPMSSHSIVPFSQMQSNATQQNAMFFTMQSSSLCSLKRPLSHAKPHDLLYCDQYRSCSRRCRPSRSAEYPSVSSRHLTPPLIHYRLIDTTHAYA